MTIEIKITGVDAADALHGLRGLAEALTPRDIQPRAVGLATGVEAGTKPEAPTAPVASDDADWYDGTQGPAPQPARRGRGRPPKKTESAPSIPPVADPPAQPAQEQEAPAPAVSQPMTAEDFRKQVRDLANRDGDASQAAAIEAVEKAGYNKIKDVNPEDYARVLDAVKAAVDAATAAKA